MEWISIKEKYPNSGEIVLIAAGVFVSTACFVLEQPGRTHVFLDESGDTEEGVTHWMPLPDPPKETEK